MRTNVEKIVIKTDKRISGLQKEKQQTQEPKRLSVMGQWRRDNPKGAFKVNEPGLFK